MTTPDDPLPSGGRARRVLVVNAGSSSLKLRLLEGSETVAGADLPAIADGSDARVVADRVAGWPTPDAIGHRIVHRGTRYTAPVRVDAEVRERLEALITLAPLHQPSSLAALDAMTKVLPDVPSVACFDTAFHATIAPEVSTYPIPRTWTDEYGIRRYGFHGLSHSYASRRAAALVDRPLDELRIVTCHLGSGASLAAISGGRSVDTTMGFTPLDGLVMSTRSGAIDPGIILWLEQKGLEAAQIDDALQHRSGLAAFGGSGDMREVEAAAARDEPDAVLALAVYNHRLVGYIAAMTATLGGLDVLVFTGGVGENSAGVRARAAERLGFLGVGLDPERNDSAEGDADISADGSPARVLVVAAREDLEIVRLVADCLG